MSEAQKEKYTTYYLGAGASYAAIPVLNELSVMMLKLVELAREIGGIGSLGKAIIDDIEKFAKAADEFGTIDTYARKLWLIGDPGQLHDLKRSLSAFFVLWSKMDRLRIGDPENKLLRQIKTRPKVDNVSFIFKDIDPRYISLLSTFLEKGPKLKKNVRFVTWNYDLQLESAFRKFMRSDDIKFDSLDEHLKYIPEENKDLDILHLNGFSGFYELGDNNAPSEGILSFTDRSTDNSLQQLLKDIAFLAESKNKDKKGFKNTLSYSWEAENPLTGIVKKQAKEILANTDKLVIIGYSFPEFNRELDKELLSGRDFKQVHYQDPTANKSLLSQAFGMDEQIINVERENMRQFIIPF